VILFGDEIKIYFPVILQENQTLPLDMGGSNCCYDRKRSLPEVMMIIKYQKLGKKNPENVQKKKSNLRI